jgi:hypothetical protein
MWGRPICAMGFEPADSRWPPLRLARLRFERESVGVVCPQLSRSSNLRLEVLW